MTSKKPRKTRPSVAQLAAADQQWASLEAQLEREMQILGPSRLQAGRILYEMKLWLKQWGFSKGRRGRWQAVCDKHKIDRKTAENWIRHWQENEGIPIDQCVVQPVGIKKSQQNSENNPVTFTGLEQPSIKAAKDEDGDRSPEGRVGIECVFVLTRQEKHQFMDAVKALGPFRATQEIYKAVIAAAPKAAGAAS